MVSLCYKTLDLIKGHLMKVGVLDTLNVHFISRILSLQQLHDTDPSGEAPRHGYFGSMKRPQGHTVYDRFKAGSK